MIDNAEEVPKGILLRDFDDFSTLRSQIFDGVKNAMVKSFPVKYGNVRLELHDVDYDNLDEVPISEQKKNLLENKYITKKLKGTLKLYDNTTDQLLEEKRLSLMKVPYLTNRGTFIHGGNEYATIMQSRLLPGVYTRRQANGELETQFNVKPGTGVGFRVGFEPETTQYRVKISQANLHMYSLMHDLGVADKELEKAWGPEIFNANKAKYDARVFDKAYERLVSTRQKKLDKTAADKINSVKAALDAAQIHARVAQKNLPNMFNPKIAAEWEARWQGKQAMEKLAAESIDSIPFEPDLTPKEAAETFIDESVLDAVENEKSAGLVSKIIPAVKNVVSSSVRSSPFDAAIKRIGSGLKWNKIESINPVDRIKNLNSAPAHLWRGHDWLNPAQISKRNWSNKLPWENKTYEGYMHGTPILSETTGYGAGIGVKGKFRESRVPDTHAKLISQYEASPSTLYGGPQDISKNNLQLWDKIKSDYQDNLILHNMYEAPIAPGTKPLSSGLLKQVDGSYYYAPTSHMDDWQKVMTDIGNSEDLMRQFRFSSAWDDIFQGTNKSAADMHALMQARRHSAQAKEEYKKKTAIMAAALARYPNEFIVDQDGRMSGITHLPTGFRIHVPREIIPKAVKRVFQEDEHELDGEDGVVQNLKEATMKDVQTVEDEAPAKDVPEFVPDFKPEDIQDAYNAIYGHYGPRLASMDKWPAEWIKSDVDPMGWLQWFEQYKAGRRSPDDDRQIKRWKSFKARHGSQFKKNPTPRRAFALRNWAIDPLKLIEDEEQRRQLAEAMENYKQKAWANYNKNSA